MIIDINFACDGCGQRLVVEAAAAGLATPCPSCARELQVPEHGATYPRLRGGFTEAASHPRVSFAPAVDDAVDQDILRRELAGAHMLVQRTEHELEALKSHLQSARDEVRESRSDRDRAAAASAQALDELHTRQAELERAQAEIQYWKERAGAHEEEQRLTAGALASARQDLAVLHAKLAEARQSLGAVSAESARLETQLAGEREAHEQALAAQAAAAAADYEGLRQNLRKTEATLAGTERDLAATQALLQEKATVEEALADTQAHLRKAETAAESAEEYGALLEEEIETLKRQLSESAAGREILELRAQREQAQEEVERLQRSLRLAEEEQHRQAAEEVSLKAGLEALRRRCLEAEQQAGVQSAAGVEILRGIIERQKAELEEQHHALSRLRKARFGVRLLYALAAILAMGVVLAVAAVLGRLMSGGHLPSLI